MRFEADLDVTVDGSSFHVRADGATLVVETDDPLGLAAALRNGGALRTRHDLIDLAERLAHRGVSVEVHGQHGPLLALGAATDTHLLRWIIGTRHVAPRLACGRLSLARPSLQRGTTLLTWFLGAIVLVMLLTLRRERR